MSKKFKALFSVFMMLAMVFAFTSVAMAADNVVNTEGLTGTVTVVFTKNCSESNNDGQRWDGLSAGDYLIPGVGAQTVSIADLNGMVKGYELGYGNPFGSKVSVFDAIYYLGQNNAKVVTLETGWSNAYTDPETGISPLDGAYIRNVNNQELESDYFVEDGIAYSIGTGFVIAVQKAGEAAPTFPSMYLSNVALEDGMTIYVDLGYYDYSWDASYGR